MTNPYKQYVEEENPYAKYVTAGARGLMAGGPIGMGAAMMNEGQKQTEQLAYGVGGKVTDMTGSPEAGFVSNVATQALPAVLTGQGATKLLSPLMQGTGKWLMKNALGAPKAAHLTGKADRAATTLLDEGANVTAGGAEKLRGSIDEINSEIASIIDSSKATISKNAVASRIQEVLKKYEAGDPADLQAIEDVWTKFLSHPSLAGKDEIPIQFAQKMKQTLGRKLGDAAYGQGLKPVAERDAWKSVVRGFKEDIAAAEPAVSPLNARESDLINAAKLVSNKVAVDANRHPLGLGALITQPWMLPIWMWDRSPLGKSLVARALYSGSERIPQILGGAAGGGAMYSAEDPGVLYRR